MKNNKNLDLSEIKLMFRSLERHKKIYHPSKYWIKLNKDHLKDLKKFGLENIKIKQSVGYFTFTIFNYRHEQFQFVWKNTHLILKVQAIIRALMHPKLSTFHLTIKQKWQYVIYNILLWEYTKSQDKVNLMNKLQEPIIGNPPIINWNKRIISQDLANSILEANSIAEAYPKTNKRIRIVEIGGGYGRDAFVLKHLYSNSNYICIDIPPALYIGQWYLSQVFKDKKIFKFRDFKSYDEVKQELEEADIAFLLPHQLELLPNKSVNLFVNISSFHEMFPKQIAHYFRLVDRLTKGVFYHKQWKVSQIPYENIIITQDEYPVQKGWVEIYKKEAKVQDKFFEAAYKIR